MKPLTAVYLPRRIIPCAFFTVFFCLSNSLLLYGGPDGELGASLRYLSQRYSMPYPELKGLLTDIGTEDSL